MLSLQLTHCKLWFTVFTSLMFLVAIFLLLLMLSDAVTANQLRLMFYDAMDSQEEYKDWNLTAEDWAAFRQIQETQRYKAYIAEATPLYVLGVEALWRGDQTQAERYASLLSDYTRRDTENTLAFMRLMMRYNAGRIGIKPTLAPTDKLLLVIDADCFNCPLYQTAIELQADTQVALSIVVASTEDTPEIQAWATRNELHQTDQIDLYPASALPAQVQNWPSLFKLDLRGEAQCIVGACWD